MTQPTHSPYSRRPTQVWTAARADYEAGASLRIVAERHGLNIRTVSRHAHDEGWEAPRTEAPEVWATARQRSDYAPSAFAESIAVEHVSSQDEAALLLRPDALGVCRYAFRRAAECAGVSGPTEALAWIRLAEATARLRRSVDVDVRPLNEADYRRVAALVREEASAAFDALHEAGPEDPEPELSELSETVP